MDKTTLKALILTKGQELGLDPQMIEQMLNAKPVMSEIDQSQLTGSELGNLQKSLNIQQDQAKAPVDLQNALLEQQSKKLSLQADTEKAETTKKGDEAIYKLLKAGKIKMTDAFITKHPLLAERYVAEGGEVSAALTDKQQQGQKLLDELERLYIGEGNQKPLAYANEGFLGRLPGMQKNIERLLSPGKTGSDTERLNTFKRVVESKRALLAKLAGDTGNLALQEQIMAGKGIPDESSTPGEALELFSSARDVYGVGPSKRLEQFRKNLSTPQAQGTDDVTARLKKAGFSDAKIKEYKKVKGIK